MLSKAIVLALASCFVSANGKSEGSMIKTANLCNVSVQRQWIRNAEDEEYDDGPPISEQPEKVGVLEFRKEGSHDMRYRVPDNDAKGNHATECKGPLCNGDGNQARFSEAVLHGRLKRVGATEF